MIIKKTYTQIDYVLISCRLPTTTTTTMSMRLSLRQLSKRVQNRPTIIFLYTTGHEVDARAWKEEGDKKKSIYRLLLLKY